MNRNADAAVALLKGLAQPVRLKLLCQLVEGEKSVGELAGALGVRDSVISQHLALLRRDGLVGNRRAGQTIFYAIADRNAARLLGLLHDIFCVEERGAASAIKSRRPARGRLPQ